MNTIVEKAKKYAEEKMVFFTGSKEIENDSIIVEVLGGVAYCNDPRVMIIDYDNKEE